MRAKETPAADSASPGVSQKERKRIALELSVRGMPSFQGSAVYRVLEPHANVAPPIVLSISGGHGGGDFLTLDLVVSPPMIAGNYQLVSTKHGAVGSYVSARLGGVDLVSDGGEATLTAIDGRHAQGTFTAHLVGLNHDRSPLTVEGTFAGDLVFDCSVLDSSSSNQAPEWVQDEKLESATCRNALEMLESAQ